jgi:hypothetical protein
MITPMFSRMGLLILLIFSSCSYGCGNGSMGTVDVFHKNRPPALKALAKTDSILTEYGGRFEIAHHLITDEETEPLIEKFGLPGSHFPFAIVINGAFSAMVGNEKIDFVHFPLFMHGIGRHEGNWSMEHLRLVLRDTTLLMEKSVLPVLDEAGDSECPGEDT